MSPLRWIRGRRRHPLAARVEFGGTSLPPPVLDDELERHLPPLEFPVALDPALRDEAPVHIRQRRAA